MARFSSKMLGKGNNSGEMSSRENYLNRDWRNMPEWWVIMELGFALNVFKIYQYK